MLAIGITRQRRAAHRVSAVHITPDIAEPAFTSREARNSKHHTTARVLKQLNTTAADSSVACWASGGIPERMVGA